MARCLNPADCDGYASIVGSRPVRDDLGRPAIWRLAICEKCGPRLQIITDNGSTTKRSVREDPSIRPPVATHH